MPVGGATLTTSSPNAERKGAELLIPHAKLTLRLQSGKEIEVKAKEVLPDEPFAVIAMVLPYQANLPADFTNGVFFPALAELRSLERVSTHIGPGFIMSNEEFAKFTVSPGSASITSFAVGAALNRKTIDAMKAMPKLTGVAMSGQFAEDPVLEALSELPRLKSLMLFQLGGATNKGLTTGGLMALCKLKLESLELADVPFWEKWAGEYGQFANIATLKSLSLSGVTRLADGDLAEIAKCKNLSELRLTSNPITDAALVHLKAMHTLRLLNLTNSKNITEAGVKALAAALPRCRIQWSGVTIEPSIVDPVNPAIVPAKTSFDLLDPSKIPAAERLPWHPKELVAVIGTHARKPWEGIYHIAFSADDKRVATVSRSDNHVWIWDTETYKLVGKIATPEPAMTCEFSPDGKSILITGDKARLYDLTVDPTKLIAELRGRVAVNTFARFAGPTFTPDSRSLVTADNDKVIIWDLTASPPKPRKEFAVKGG